MSKSRILLAGVAFFVTLICWALSSPINSNSDERFHIGSVWCSNGYNANCEFLGRTSRGTEVAWINLDLCTPDLGNDTQTRILVDRKRNLCLHSTADYSPITQFEKSPNFKIEANGYVATNISKQEFTLYSKLMNRLSSNNGALSIIAIRILNSFIFCFLLILFLTSSPPKFSNSVLLTTLLVSTPLFVFQVASVNPSSWAITGCSFNWAFMLCMVERRIKFDRRLIVLIIGWLFSLIISITHRTETVIFNVFMNLLIVGVSLAEKTNNKKVIVAGVWVSVLLISSTIIAKLSSANIMRLLTIEKDSFDSAKNIFLAFGGTLKVLVAIPLRMFGYEQFGWLGIVSPNIVPLITLSVTVVIVHRQMSKDNHKQIIYFVCFTAFLFLIIYHQILIQVSSQISSLPPFYYVRTGWRWDSFFTSRYFMPLAFGLISPLIIFADDLSWRSYGTSHVMINLLPFAHATSLYTIGKPFRDHPNWFWSNLPFGNDLVLLGGSLSFFAFTYLVVTAEPIRYRILTTTDN